MAGSVQEILDRLTLRQVWFALGGGALIRNRGRAFWRNGDGFNVRLTAENTWYDHRDKVGGGMVDLVVHVRQVSKQDAWQFLAGLAGISLPPEKPEVTARIAEIAADLPDAELWRHAAIDLTEDLLEQLKAGLFDPTLPQPAIGEIRHHERQLARYRSLNDSQLVDEYRAWLKRDPVFTQGMVYAARQKRLDQQRTVEEFLESVE